MSTALGINCCGCEGPGTSVQVGGWEGRSGCQGAWGLVPTLPLSCLMAIVGEIASLASASS